MGMKGLNITLGDVDLILTALDTYATQIQMLRNDYSGFLTYDNDKKLYETGISVDSLRLRLMEAR